MKGISSTIKTLNNWMSRIRCYGFRNSLRLYRNLRRDATFSLKHYGHDFYLRGNSVDFAVFNGIFANGEYDFEVDFKPEFIVDAGAFIGASAVRFTTRFPAAKIIAIEPEETNFSQLVRNTEPYKNIVPVHAALYGEDTSVRITDPSAEKYAFRVEPGDAGESTLKAFTVDTVMKMYGLPRIDILKMDIEGAEYDLFSSGDKGWLRKVRVLVIELHEFFRPGVTELFRSVLAGMKHDEMRRGENIIIINREAAG